MLFQCICDSNSLKAPECKKSSEGGTPRTSRFWLHNPQEFWAFPSSSALATPGQGVRANSTSANVGTLHHSPPSLLSLHLAAVSLSDRIKDHCCLLFFHQEGFFFFASFKLTMDRMLKRSPSPSKHCRGTQSREGSWTPELNVHYYFRIYSEVSDKDVGGNLHA